MGQDPFSPPSVKGWPYAEGWISANWIRARKRGLLRLLADEEVWESRSLPSELSEGLVPFPPINLTLPAKSTRENIAMLFSDPSWQFAGPFVLNDTLNIEKGKSKTIKKYSFQNHKNQRP